MPLTRPPAQRRHGAKVRALIVDDSAPARQLLARLLVLDGDIEVVGVARDAYGAREQIKRLDPDVITLDIEMPRMDGVTFLENLMRLRPTPVVMVSSLTRAGADVTLRALELGAVDFLPKPVANASPTLAEYGAEVRGKVRMAAGARLGCTMRAGSREVLPHARSVRAAGPVLAAPTSHGAMLVAIGASTGGTEALRVLVEALPAACPPILVAQHIPAAFTAALARRLDALGEIKVQEAVHGQPLLPGNLYLAPGDRHLAVSREAGRPRCLLDDGPPVNRHRPSVDVLFYSLAHRAGPNCLGILLTGMGTDGARGLKALRDAGGSTVAQDEATSVVWGMPGSAVRMEAAEHVVPLQRIPALLLELAARRYRDRTDGTGVAAHRIASR